MDSEKLDNIGDEAMAGKIMSIGIILKVFSGIIFDKMITSPIKFARITKLSFKLKKDIQQIQTTQDNAIKLDSTISLIATILAYRHTNPQEMDMVFDLLEEVIQKYNANPDIKQEILKLMEKNATK